MRYAWTPEQAAVGDSARALLDRALVGQTRQQIAADSDGFSADLWRQLAETGLLGILVPDDLGGGGGQLLDAAAFAEAAGAALLPGPWLETVVMAPTAVAAAARRGATGAAGARWLSGCADGTVRATFAAGSVEHGGRPGFGGLSARRVRDGIRLTGRRVLVPYPELADCAIVTATMDRQPALLLTPLPDGVTRRSTTATDPLYRLGQLDFDCVVDADCLLATGSQAQAVLAETRQAATAVRCVEMLGGARAILTSTAAYVANRRQFDQQVGAFQAVKHRLATAAMQTENIAAAAYWAAWAVQERVAPSEAVAVAKAYASEAYVDICRACLQMHGGIGFTWEADVHLYLKHARRCASTLGTTAEHLAAIADELSSPASTAETGTAHEHRD